MFFWYRNWLGGGDVKLMAATAILLPPSGVLPFIVWMSVSGSVLALIYLVARRVLPAPGRLPSHARQAPLIARALRAENWRIHRGGPLPYVCAITAGFLFVAF